MKPRELFEELTAIAKSLGFTIRKDTGNFRSSNCILRDEKIILLNKFNTPEAHNRTLASAINLADNNSIYIKPVVREFLAEEMEKPLDDALKDLSIERDQV